jgi:hypothetical protein
MPHKRGDEWHLQKAKADVGHAEIRLRGVLSDIESGRKAEQNKPAAEQELREARAALEVWQRRVDATKFDEIAAEFDTTLEELDRVGWTPQAEARVVEILAACRMVGRSGQSSETLRVFVERMKNPVKFTDRRLRWSNLKTWIKRTTEIAA